MDGDRAPTEQENTGATSTAAKVYNLLLPSNSVRTWQLILMVLTVFGSMFSSSNFSGTSMRLEVKPQLVAAIFAMGILHVGALEAFLRSTANKVPAGHGGPARMVRAAHRALQGRPLSTEEALARLPYTPEQISGFWLKDKKRSDSMMPACDIMNLHGVMRHAVSILKGTRILLTGETFHVAAVSLIPVIKVAERYALSGEEGQFRRRDQRRGGSWGCVQLSPDGVVFNARWEDPLAGNTRETFRLVNPRELHIVTEMWVGSRSCTYTQVYTKQR